MEPNEVIPLVVVRALVKIEDAINETQQEVKDKKKTLSKQNSVSLNKLKQKFKKYLLGGPTGNTYEQQLLKFREKPVWSEDERAAASTKKKAQVAAAPLKKKPVPVESESEDDEDSEDESEDEDSDEDSDEEDTKKAVKKPATVTAKAAPLKKQPKGSDDDSEEEDEESEEEEEESEVEEESEEEESEEEEEVNVFNMPREQLTPAQRRLKWVKFERLPLYL